MLLLKIALGLICAGALLFAGIFAAVCICAWLPRSCDHADCLIVLGAKLHPDGKMSRSLVCRCDTVADAYRRGIASHIVACGGKVKDAPCSEASAMARYLIDAGIPAERILQEGESVNTFENLRNTKAIMEARGFQRAALVTSDYHLERALWLARGAGINVCGIPARSSLRPRHFMKARLRESISWMLYVKCEINKKIHK